MSSLRRLHQRRTESGSSTAAASSSSRRLAANGSSSTELPAYQTLECALSPDAKKALAKLVSSRSTKKYEENIKASLENLGKSTAAINDDLRESQIALENMRRKGTSRDLSIDEFAESTAKQSERVTSLTAAAEKTVRELIDRQAELADDKVVLGEVSAFVATQPESQDQPSGRQSRARNVVPEDDDEDAAHEDAAHEEEDVKMHDAESRPPPQSLEHLFSQGREAKKAEYRQLTAHARYGLNNDYVAFKKIWHDSTNEEGTELPNANRWFDEHGEPVMTVRRAAVGLQASGDEDEDLIITGGVRDYKCPLTMADLQEPLTSRVCKHSYEAASIKAFIQGNGQVICPVVGCDKTLRKQDLYTDEVFIRQMKRHRQREQDHASQEDMDEDMNDESIITNGSRRLRRIKEEDRRRQRGRERDEIEDDVEDEADEDVADEVEDESETDQDEE